MTRKCRICRGDIPEHKLGCYQYNKNQRVTCSDKCKKEDKRIMQRECRISIKQAQQAVS